VSEHPKKEILARMHEVAVKNARRVKTFSDEWFQLLEKLEKEGGTIEHSQPEVQERLMTDVKVGILDVWVVGDDMVYITEKGFAPGNISLS